MSDEPNGAPQNTGADFEDFTDIEEHGLDSGGTAGQGADRRGDDGLLSDGLLSDVSASDTYASTQQMADEEKDDSFYIVGVGASAGGLEALEMMFDSIESDCGLAFVVIQHLSPDFKSLMDEILARHTSMAIHRVTHEMVVEPNAVYLIPPRQEMIIANGILLLEEKTPGNMLSLPIDRFFISLAAEQGDKAIGVVLSGTGSDGSKGAQAIAQEDGLVLAQTLESAKFDGMPSSVLATNAVHATVHPDQIGEFLKQYITKPIKQLVSQMAQPKNETSMEQIFRLLQQRHQIDFNHYKPDTIRRRIDRRADLDFDGDLAGYAQLLSRQEKAVDQLYRDLLIGVTHFFRDNQPFETLQKDVLPRLLKQCKPGEEFRVWVAACATGEEAYTVAILINECLEELNKSLAVKIFATDVHQASIATATVGIYPAESIEKVSPSRRKRYFTPADKGYQIANEIRQMVVFAKHNLIKDPPFTRLCLVTCRNFLIYLRPDSQERVLAMLNFGLSVGGVMLLGSSENMGPLGEDFETLDQPSRLFLKTRDSAFPFFSPEDSPVSHRTLTKSQQQRIESQAVEDNEKIKAYEHLLTRYMPPGIIVDNDRRIIQIFGGAGKFLNIDDGKWSQNILELVDHELRLAINGGLQRCSRTEEAVDYEGLRVQASNGEENINLVILPIPHAAASKRYLIAFEPIEARGVLDSRNGQNEHLQIDEVSRNQVAQLELELRSVKDNLQATIEQVEANNEELQVTNEELVASNEELQSTNEELHSVNEELFTVNAEHQRKIIELTELTNDFENLLASTNVHTLFLDEKLAIRKFTPQIAEVFHLVPHDLGRDISAFVHSISCEGLIEKIRKVLETEEIWEEKVEDNHGGKFLMRVLPYRASEITQGVVLTLIDIASLVEAEQQLGNERERFERAIQANRDGIWDWPDLKSEQMWWSPTCYQILGYEPDAFPSTHSRWLALIHPDDRVRIEQTSVPAQEKCFVELHQEFEYRMMHQSGQYRWYCHRAVVDHDENGRAFRMTGSIADIEDRKISELEAAEGIRARDHFLLMLSHELRNPMGAVTNAVHNELMLREEKSADASPPLQVIERQTRHMGRLLDDLLDVARLGRGRIEFRKEVFDLRDLASRVIEAVDFEFQLKNQTIKASVTDQPLPVFGDAVRLIQAQVNLLVNASKYSDSGSEVRYLIHGKENEAIISVIDQGTGIPEDLIDTIFNMFVQSESTLSRSTGGMGLGLSLARGIIDAHGGSITVQSDGVGCGSTFQICLPLTTAEISQPTQSSDLQNFSATGYKIMLIDDNQDGCEMLGQSFRRLGFDVSAAHDGISGLKQFAENLPDVAIIDIGLPGLTGYEVAQAIRHRDEWSSCMLIALTGYGRQADQEEALSAGFDAHFVKPLKFRRLHEMIVNHLNQRIQP